MLNWTHGPHAKKAMTCVAPENIQLSFLFDTGQIKDNNSNKKLQAFPSHFNSPPLPLNFPCINLNWVLQNRLPNSNTIILQLPFEPLGANSSKPIRSHSLLPNQSNWLQFSKHSDISISVLNIYIYIYIFFETFYVEEGYLKPGNNC